MAQTYTQRAMRFITPAPQNVCVNKRWIDAEYFRLRLPERERRKRRFVCFQVFISLAFVFPLFSLSFLLLFLSFLSFYLSFYLWFSFLWFFQRNWPKSPVFRAIRRSTVDESTRGRSGEVRWMSFLFRVVATKCIFLWYLLLPGEKKISKGFKRGEECAYVQNKAGYTATLVACGWAGAAKKS